MHRSFERELEENTRASMVTLFAEADRSLGAFLRQSAPARLASEPRLYEHACAVSAAVVRLHDWGLEYAILQDAGMVVRAPAMRDGRVFEDPRPRAFRDVFLQAQARRLLRAQGFSDPEFLRHLQAMRELERKTRNTPDGYPALVGDERITRKVLRERLRVPMRDLELVLVSPGAARAWDVFQMPLRTLFTDGLSDWAQELRRRESSDDQGRWFPRESRHDDIGILRIRVLTA